jgi:hypothetical protein
MWSTRETSPVEIQIPAHWNLIGHAMTAAAAVIAQQYSSANSVSLSLQSHKDTNESTLFKNVTISFFFSCFFS